MDVSFAHGFGGWNYHCAWTEAIKKWIFSHFMVPCFDCGAIGHLMRPNSRIGSSLQPAFLQSWTMLIG